MRDKCRRRRSRIEPWSAAPLAEQLPAPPRTIGEMARIDYDRAALVVFGG